MVFTKNDIMLESTCMGDIAQISVACDLMMESFVDGSDEDTFEEAGGKVFDSIKSAASAIIEKIKKFITDSIRSIKDKMDKKKIEDAIKTLKDFDMKKAEKEFKIRKGPDVLKAYDLLMKYEDMVDKYIGQLDTSFENMTDRQKMTKLVKFSEEVDKNCNKILGEIETTLTSPDKQIVYNPTRYEAILRLGLNLDGNYEKFGARITTATDRLNAKINETFRMVGENVEFTMEAFGRKKEEPEMTKKDKLLATASDIKSGLMTQLHSLQGFIVKHKKAVIAITSAVVVTATGILVYKNTDSYKALKDNKVISDLKADQKAQVKAFNKAWSDGQKDIKTKGALGYQLRANVNMRRNNKKQLKDEKALQTALYKMQK